MKKKLFFTAFIAITLAVGIAITGCDLAAKGYEFVFINESSYTVTVAPGFATFGFDSFKLSPGESKSITLDVATINFNYSPADKVRSTTSQSPLRFVDK